MFALRRCALPARSAGFVRQRNLGQTNQRQSLATHAGKLNFLTPNVLTCLSRTPLDAVRDARKRFDRVAKAYESKHPYVVTSIESFDTTDWPFLTNIDSNVWSTIQSQSLPLDPLQNEIADLKKKGLNLTFTDSIEILAFSMLVKEAGLSGNSASVETIANKNAKNLEELENKLTPARETARAYIDTYNSGPLAHLSEEQLLKKINQPDQPTAEQLDEFNRKFEELPAQRDYV